MDVYRRMLTVVNTFSYRGPSVNVAYHLYVLISLPVLKRIRVTIVIWRSNLVDNIVSVLSIVDIIS